MGTVDIGRNHVLVTMSSAVVGVLSYLCGLLLAHWLPPGEYSDFSAAQALLTVVGIVASSLVPLPLARTVGSNAAGSRERRDGVAFALVVALVTGAVAGFATALLTLNFAPPVTALTAGLAGFALVLVTPVWGWLQGELRFRRFAALSVTETLLRLVFSVAVAGLLWGAAGGVAGYVAGAVAVLGIGFWWMRRDVAWRPGAARDTARWAETTGIALVQLVTCALTTADILLVATMTGDPVAAAGYQAVATLAKAPVYVATGAVLLSFPLVRASRDETVVDTLLRSYLRLAGAAAALLVTVPAPLALVVLPPRYRDSLSLLPWLTLAGLGYGAIMVAAILLLARQAYRRLLAGLAVACVLVLTGLALGARHGTSGLAVGAAAAAVLAAVVLLWVSGPVLPRFAYRIMTRIALVWGAFAGVLYLLRPVPAVWAVVVAVVGLSVLRPKTPAHPVTTSDRLEILHLGFEDPLAPGAGGGSRRTHEINRRLAANGHRITVLTTRFPGCRDQVRDGVSYVHIGLGRGRTRLGRVLGYLCRLPAETRGRPAHLVVEDFFAPISSFAAPLWTGRPTIGMVQWLNAREKARQYHVPVQFLERFGTRRHRHLIAVSEDLAVRLKKLNPRATVEVIGNGVEPAVHTGESARGPDVVFVGRLEKAQKGLDLLLQAWAKAVVEQPGNLVLAGAGPDESYLRASAERLGIADRVRFAGWVDGLRKQELLARARLVVVPSRFETFGIVAVEALASGTPVVAFDIPCLREVVPAECGRLVAAFDIDEYAAAVVSMYHDTACQARTRTAGPRFAARYDWDALAARQEQVYRELVPPPLTARKP
ncbi:glycosyltransferase [Amycolatopsis sp. GM8]|uniref:glycosyltransferase n=1 Tax=Amycolatopsis sp. GM8 TaxID=2896530 RepID=UPI001F2BA75B|nr:glycosyltransferase [Amycolatopsis sp. GM8]